MRIIRNNEGWKDRTPKEVLKSYNALNKLNIFNYNTISEALDDYNALQGMKRSLLKRKEWFSIEDYVNGCACLREWELDCQDYEKLVNEFLEKHNIPETEKLSLEVRNDA